MLVSCVVGVWLGRISVVLTTVRSRATPDFEENKQADASTRLFSKVFSADAARCCEIARQQSVKVYLQHPPRLSTQVSNHQVGNIATPQGHT